MALLFSAVAKEHIFSLAVIGVHPHTAREREQKLSQMIYDRLAFCYIVLFMS